MYFSNFHSLPEHLVAVSKLSFTYERRAAIIVIVIFTIAQYYGKRNGRPPLLGSFVCCIEGNFRYT